MEYKILATEFTKKGYTYKQIWREGDFAIYEQRKENCAVPHYESIEITRHDGYTIGEAVIPPSEVYPNNEAWGKTGWTSVSLEQAQKYIEKMRNHTSEITAKNQEVDPVSCKKSTKSSLKLPIVEFSVKDLSLLNPNVKIQNIYAHIRKLLKTNQIKETKKISNLRGKPSPFYQKI